MLYATVGIIRSVSFALGVIPQGAGAQYVGYRLGRRARVLAAVTLVQLASSANATCLPVVLPFIRNDFNLSLAHAGLAVGISGVGTFLALFGVGWFVLRLGERTVLLVGAAVSGLATIGAATSPNFSWLLLALVLLGIGTAAPTPAGSSTIVREFSAQSRGTAMGIRLAAAPLGAAAGALMLAPIAYVINWRYALLVGAAVVILGGVTGWLLLPGDKTESKQIDVDSPRFDSGSRKSGARNLALVGAYGLIVVAGQAAVTAHLVLYLNRAWSIPALLGASILSLLQLSGGLGRIGWGWLSDRFFSASRARLLSITSTVAAAVVGVLAWLPLQTPPWVAVGVVFLVGGVLLAWSGVYFTLIGELASKRREGRAVAIAMAMNQPGVLLGPWLFGVGADRTGSYRLSWAVLAIGLLIAGVAMNSLKRGSGLWLA